MNALFDEQNNIVAEYAAEALIPNSVFDGMIIHHEDLLLQKVETIITPLGGNVAGHTIRAKGDQNV